VQRRTVVRDRVLALHGQALSLIGWTIRTQSAKNKMKETNFRVKCSVGFSALSEIWIQSLSQYLFLISLILEGKQIFLLRTVIPNNKMTSLFTQVFAKQTKITFRKNSWVRRNS
jgi:hypothetical protein